MPKPIIFVTRILPRPALDRLAEVFDLRLNELDRPLTPAELRGGIADADALLCLLTDSVDADLISAAPRLRVISNYAVGYNNIDVEFATRRGIAVCNTPGVLSESTADLAWALIMSCARRIVESNRFVREGRFSGWEPLLFLGNDIHAKTLGIVGMGRIGQVVAKRASGFEMRVLYHDPSADTHALPPSWQAVELSYLLQNSDFVSLHAPLTPQTRHLIGAEQLALMKPTAVLINTARGPIIDESALIAALRERRIAAAGLDVFEAEPHIPPELLELDNAVLLPHIGSASVETRTRMGLLAAENAIAVVTGKDAPARVN